MFAIGTDNEIVPIGIIAFSQQISIYQLHTDTYMQTCVHIIHAYIPWHACLSTLSLNPLLQLSHLLAPSLGHFMPVEPTPLAHEHTFSAHVDLSGLTVHPVLQLATRHPDEYDVASLTAQAAKDDANGY